VHELDGIAEVGQVLADILFSGGDGIGAMERYQVFGVEASGNLQAVNVIQRISLTAALSSTKPGRLSTEAISIRLSSAAAIR
jgi:hypothetical protein